MKILLVVRTEYNDEYLTVIDTDGVDAPTGPFEVDIGYEGALYRAGSRYFAARRLGGSDNRIRELYVDGDGGVTFGSEYSNSVNSAANGPARWALLEDGRALVDFENTTLWPNDGDGIVMVSADRTAATKVFAIDPTTYTPARPLCAWEEGGGVGFYCSRSTGLFRGVYTSTMLGPSDLELVVSGESSTYAHYASTVASSSDGSFYVNSPSAGRVVHVSVGGVATQIRDTAYDCIFMGFDNALYMVSDRAILRADGVYDDVIATDVAPAGYSILAAVALAASPPGPQGCFWTDLLNVRQDCGT